MNYLVPTISGLLIILSFVNDHYWHDRRTTKYKKLRTILFTVIIISVIFNIILVSNGEREKEKLNNSIDSLKNKMATLENQNSMLSILDRMQRFMVSDYNEMSKKYPIGYFLFASNRYTLIPSVKTTKNLFYLDWASCELREITDKFLHILIKKITFYPNHIEIKNLNVVLEKKVGAVADGIFMNGIGLNIELVDERDNEIIYAIGFKHVEKVPKERKPDEQVSAFVRNNQLPALFDGIDTNIKTYITIDGITISSGWQIVRE